MPNSFSFAVFPVRFYPFPLTERENLAVNRTISINALQQPTDIVAVPQRSFAATKIKSQEDLLNVGVLISEWKKTKEDKDIWWLKVNFGAAVKVNRIWFDENASCFMGEGELIHLVPTIEEEGFALADACRYILGYFNSNDFFELIPTLRTIIQKAYNWVRSNHPTTIAADEDAQEKLVKVILSVLDAGEINYFLLPSDYESILSSKTFKEFVFSVLDFVKKLDSRIEEIKRVRAGADEFVARQNRIVYLTSLRETINNELREITHTTGDTEVDELLSQIENNEHLPADLKEKLREELEAVGGHIQNPERPIVMRHVQFVLSLPWGKYAQPNTDFKEVRETLEKSHYGLEDAKERILEYLALYTHLKRPPKGNILCFIGPPGTGKTSMAAAVAEALKLPFRRISLGGVSDEAEVKGHRRTYIGAMPGRIASALAQLGALNGIIFIDEIDKLGISYKGRPDAALLDALDPERNFEFVDHYVDYPIDLSNILFICGANVQENIDPTLADRLEFIHFSGYTYPEKFAIAKHYIVPKVKQEWKIDEIEISDDAIDHIVKVWGRWEAGVRETKRQIESAFRKALSYGEKVITAKFIREHFPPPTPMVEWKAEYAQHVGFIPIVAVNQVGEGTVFWAEIHKVKAESSKEWGIEIIGSADESMRESAKSAYLWCYHHLPSFAEAPYKWVIYLPAVSLKKSGPSASLAFAVGLACTHANKPLNRLIAMTGEISATGQILPVGSVAAKVIAAENAGMEEIIIPEANRNEFEFWLRRRKVPIRIKVSTAENISEVLHKLCIAL